MDAACSLLLLGWLLVLWMIHVLRAPANREQYARVDMEGASALLSRGTLEALYAMIAPIGSACARVGLTANAITGLSLLLALAGSTAFALDHLGLGSLLAVGAMASDAVDGWVARRTGTASEAGEVLDAAADRYVELSLFVGLAIHLRHQPITLLCALGALAGSFMVSYSSAKAEALGVTPPRGSMRRTERACLLIAGAALTPLSLRVGLPAPWGEAPLLFALTGLTLFSNASAISRLTHIVRELQRRAAPRTPEPRSPSTVDSYAEPDS